MAAVHREAIQKQIQQDWANREYIEVITGSIKKITDFLNSFGNYLTFLYLTMYFIFILEYLKNILQNNKRYLVLLL